MRELLKTFPLMCAVLAIPIVPFLIFGARFEQWLRQLSENPPSDVITGALVIGLLSTDILLPIPSSVISTMSGWQLGVVWGTITTWLGMNLGAVLGFAMARRWGHSFARWFSSEEDLGRMNVISERFGPTVLVMTRALPVFAEASVLIGGIHRLSWRRFLPPVLLSNLGIAVGYAALGDYAGQHQWLPFALGVAIAVPVLVAAASRRFLK